MSRSRPFAVLWSANAASNLADGLAFVSIPLLASTLTDDPRLVAGLDTVYALVRLLVALPIGVYVDRIDRRTILVIANLLRGGAVLGLAICVLTGIQSLVLLYVVFAVVGTLESAADNASITLVRSVVPPGELDRANSRITTAQLIADDFAGPPLGGFLFAITAALPVFAIGGLWAGAGAIALALPVRRTATPEDAVTTRPSMWHEAAAGASWLAHHRVVGGLAVIGGLASTGYMLAFSILVIFARERLGLDAAGYGLMLAATAIGGLLASLVAAWVRTRIGYRWTIVASLLLGAATLLLLSTTENPWIAALLLALYSFHAVVWGICSTSIRQRLVPDALLGRVNAAMRVLGLLGLALGSLLGGLLGAIDIALPVAIGGVVFIACAVTAAFFIRSIEIE